MYPLPLPAPQLLNIQHSDTSPEPRTRRPTEEGHVSTICGPHNNSAPPQIFLTQTQKKKKSHRMRLPVMFSCLGQIPREDVDKQSSSSGVTWTPTSTGLDALLSSAFEGEGGLSTALSMHKVPLHCFLLCSMKIRMSPKGKFI